MARSYTAKDSRYLTQEWFSKAEADIDFAKLGFKETEHYGQVCTATLARKCSLVNKEFKRFIRPCKALDRHYIPPRYPVAIAILYRKQDAKEALEFADSVIGSVISLLA